MAPHARSAARRGANAEGVAEALGVVLLMNGGRAPCIRALEAFHEFGT
jgi:hypothetical protein